MEATPRLDLLGQKFGRLTVIGVGYGRNGNGKARRRCLCQCECGELADVDQDNLLAGRSASCGCGETESRIKHEHARTGAVSRTYSKWLAMTQRCTNPNNKRFPDYGGRGIKVCDRWLPSAGGSFENFLADMGECPPGLSIDRYPDNDGDYEPGNVRWATDAQQNRNTRRNRIVTYQGQKMTLVDACTLAGLSYPTVAGRLNRGGWSEHDALTTPPGQRRPHR